MHRPKERTAAGMTNPENLGISLTRLARLPDVYDDVANLHRRRSNRSTRRLIDGRVRPYNRPAIAQIDGVLLCPRRPNNDRRATSGDRTLYTVDTAAAYVFVALYWLSGILPLTT